MKSPSILWYDLETFGLDSRGDRIAQFAAIRTNLALEQIEEPIVLYCKLSDDYLPDPLSCLVTGITPQEVNEKGFIEAEFIALINKEFSRPNTTVAGFNSIRFDDEFIRSALYRNFFDPYKREWEYNNSRWDIIDLVRAAHDLRPDGIIWPDRSSENRPVFRLTSLTEANEIEQIGAHDALVDVRATIAVAKLIKEKQPKLYEYYYNLRSKSEVKKIVSTPFGQPILYTTPLFSSELGNTRLVLPITHLKTNPNAVLAFDLSQDATALLTADPSSIMMVPGVVTISVNKCPFVAPLGILSDEVAQRLGIDKDAALAKAAYIATQTKLLARIHSMKERFEVVDDVDYQIYSAFFTAQDQKVFDELRKAKPEEKMSFSAKVHDSRFGGLLFRHIGRNWPEVFNAEDIARWRSHCANRTLNPPGDGKMNWKYFYRSIDEKLESVETTPQEKQVLASLKEYGKALEQRIFGKDS